ncbi:glycosyltransferase family 87 protein [Bradyrhizobium sp. OAE829]|uniref:glycosyltransferase family 87 protein n=1 Tax=Bradyrhizobium sp. OAE829 TaxID=2663807 RepID=UPI00178BD1A5
MNQFTVLPAKFSIPWTRLLQWRADDRKTGYLCTLLLVSCGIFLAVMVYVTWSVNVTQATNGELSSDFFALWSYAKIASEYSATELYDSVALHAREVALGMDPSLQKWFPYPPTAIFLLWPLGLLPYGAAYVAWVVGTLGLFLWAVVATCSRSPLCIVGVLVAPVTAATIGSGQSGFLAAALITGGIRLAPSRPILGGILLGLLTYKPQLGLLVPIALIAAGNWRAAGVACATAMGLAIVSVLVFGWSLWPAWIAMLPEYQAAFDRSHDHQLHLMPTILSNLKMAGFQSPMVEGVQAASSVIVAVLVGRCFYRNAGRLAAASLFVGTLLATPHAFIYDMPMILAAMALFIEEHRQTNATFSLVGILVLSLAMLFPLMMLFQYPDAPVSSLSLLMLFCIILYHESPFVVTGLLNRLGAKATKMATRLRTH